MGCAVSSGDMTSLIHGDQPGQEVTFEFVSPDNRVSDIWTRFREERTLGEGVSCRVMKATRLKDGDTFAMKEMGRDDIWNHRMFASEVRTLQKLQHPNIVRLCESYIDHDNYNFYICFELCTGGELFARVKKMHHFSESLACKYVVKILDAIFFCHSHNIVHRDLKPENIMMDRPTDDANLVIIDFGDAREVNDLETFTDFVGTPHYLAPESIRHRRGWELKSSDMWTIGVITYVLLTGRVPFGGRNNKEILVEICRKPVSFPSYVKLSSAARNFILSLLERDTRHRMTAAEALEHPWIVIEGPQTVRSLGAEYLKNLATYHNAVRLKKLLVNRLVSEMTEEEKHIIKLAFFEMDLNNDGFITMSELVHYMEMTGLDRPRAERRAKDLLHALDENGDNKIDLREFTHAHTSNEAADEERIADLFQRLDTNHDGKLTAQELLEGLEDVLDEPVDLTTMETIMLEAAQVSTGNLSATSVDFSGDGGDGGDGGDSAFTATSPRVLRSLTYSEFREVMKRL